MAIYTVHEIADPKGNVSREESAVFVRDGFSFAAFIFGPIWLLWHRLWLGLIVWLVAEAIIMALGAWVIPGSTATTILELIVALVLGLEASQLRRGSLSRRGYALVDIVSARRAEAAERSFFESRMRSTFEGPSVRPVSDGRIRPAEMVGLFPSLEGRGA